MVLIWENVVRVYFLRQRHAYTANEKGGCKIYAEEYNLCRNYTRHNTLETKSGWKHNKEVASSPLTATVIDGFPFLFFVYLDIPKHRLSCVIINYFTKENKSCWGKWEPGLAGEDMRAPERVGSQWMKDLNPGLRLRFRSHYQWCSRKSSAKLSLKDLWQASFSRAPTSVRTVTAAMKLKDICSLEEKLWQT